MPYETDERLKGYLDTNQLHREQMCRALLAIDKRFMDVRPRHPRGGPDGGRDIDATFKGDQKVYGAVGFINQANDSEEHKKKIKVKFTDDIKNALSNIEDPEVFVFLTNVNLTLSEKDDLVADAKKAGFMYCEIFDRERLRISLDSPDGFSIRFQYLGLPLSDEEQASFFAKWGDDIQSVISTGFQRIETTLDRVLFLQEAADVMSTLAVAFELDRVYRAEEIGHFRAFCYVFLKEPKYNILRIVFGSSDKSNRMRNDLDVDFSEQIPGIKYGIGGGQWEYHIDINKYKTNSPQDDDEESEKMIQVGSSSSIGMREVKYLQVHYNHDSFIRFFPRMKLRDLDDATFIFMINKSLAEKIDRIHIFSNEYKLQEISGAEFNIDYTSFDPIIPATFSAEELNDPWVRIRPSEASAFNFRFSDQTPKRLFEPKQTINSLEKKKMKQR